MTPIKKILLAVDFSTASEAAIEQAVSLCKTLDATLSVVHVYEAPIYAYPNGAVPLTDYTAALEQTARAELDALVKRLSERGLHVEAQLRQGSAWRNINEVAKELGAGLIVVGTHGRHGVSRALIGSIAEKVVRTSQVPVLTVRAEAP
jgi:nucleotide-binding universal stress UspA family protein